MTTFNGPTVDTLASGTPYVPALYDGMSDELTALTKLAGDMAPKYPIFLDFFKLYHAKESLEAYVHGELDDETIAYFVEVKAFFDKLNAYFIQLNTRSETIRNGGVYKAMNKELLRQLSEMSSKVTTFYNRLIPPQQHQSWEIEHDLRKAVAA